MSDVAAALVDVVLDGASSYEEPGRMRRLLVWAARLMKPPLGVRLVSDDGQAFTGFVLVERNQPIAMLALSVSPTREGASSSASRQRPVYAGVIPRRDEDEHPL